MGYVVLQGGGEFKGEMRRSDLRALELAGGPDAPVVIIPAAAAPDDNHLRAGENGRRWFESLGARRVAVAPVIDGCSARNRQNAAILEQARLVYLLGGFPGHLARTLHDSIVWKAIISALDRGGVLAGSSAGAMVICDFFYDPGEARIVQGLGCVTGCCVLPHHNTYGHLWAPLMQKELPGATLLGIDEQTGMIGDESGDRWQVMGGGNVSLYINGEQRAFADGSDFRLPDGEEVRRIGC